MNAPTNSTRHLLTRRSEVRCQHCPPERVCAWACIQGASPEEIVTGAVLEQSLDWALNLPQPGEVTVQQALWEMFNT